MNPSLPDSVDSLSAVFCEDMADSIKRVKCLNEQINALFKRAGLSHLLATAKVTGDVRDHTIIFGLLWRLAKPVRKEGETLRDYNDRTMSYSDTYLIEINFFATGFVGEYAIQMAWNIASPTKIITASNAENPVPIKDFRKFRMPDYLIEALKEAVSPWAK